MVSEILITFLVLTTIIIIILSILLGTHKCEEQRRVEARKQEPPRVELGTIEVKVEPTKSAIYMHVCLLGSWKEVTLKMLNLIAKHMSGTTVNLVVVGEDIEQLNELIKPFPYVIIRKHNVTMEHYERETLEIMHDDATKSKNNFNMLYLHSKGVTKKDEKTIQFVNDWIDYMLYFLVELNGVCEGMLNIADTCGVNLLNRPHLHYSGNFWWATSTYIKSLNRTIGKDYFDPEFWIGLNSPRAISLWESKLNHYYYPYKRKIYEDQRITPQLNPK